MLRSDAMRRSPRRSQSPPPSRSVASYEPNPLSFANEFPYISALVQSDVEAEEEEATARAAAEADLRVTLELRNIVMKLIYGLN